MKNVAVALAFAAAFIAPASAITIKFQNNCGYSENYSVARNLPLSTNLLSLAVWPAVGKAPNGQPDRSVAFGTRLGPGASASFGVGDTQIVGRGDTCTGLILTQIAGHPSVGTYGL